jgi:hypothetical protein
MLALRVSAWTVAIAAIVTAWVVGLPRLQTRVAAAAQSTALDVQFANQPVWVNTELRNTLADIIAAELRGDVFDRIDLERARAALLGSGWFEEVRQVQRLRSDLLLVDADFVTPFAVVRDKEGEHLVDPTGRLLPMTFPKGSQHNFVTIVGAHFPRPAHAPQQWEGGDISAALKLLRRIDDRPWKEQIATVDISTALQNQMLVLTSDRGCRLIWGAPPGHEAALEALADRKIAYLDYHFENHGHIDLGHTGEIDLTGKDHVAKR